MGDRPPPGRRPRPRHRDDTNGPRTPFGPDDNVVPDIPLLTERLAALRQELLDVQLELTEMRHGPGPDGTPPEVYEPSRVEGLWPYLVIRQWPGDAGIRPLDMSVTDSDVSKFRSPDIIVLPAGPSDEPVVADREHYPAGEGSLEETRAGNEMDVWVHAWNLGQFQATAVRVRVWLLGPIPHGSLPAVPAGATFLGGRQLDLGNRLSDSSHRLVKAATFVPTDPGGDGSPMMLRATAECLTDPASDDRSPGLDRHTAYRLFHVNP